MLKRGENAIKLTRARRRANDVEIARYWSTYKERRKSLKKDIMRSKQRRWRDLVSELDGNIWGQAYKIATKRIGCQGRPRLARC